MENKPRIHQDQREYARLKYLPEEKSLLKILSYEFKVLDISRGGLRFLNDREARLPDQVAGKLVFANGNQHELEGTIVWEQDDEFGLFFSQLMSSDVFEGERRYVISHRS